LKQKEDILMQKTVMSLDWDYYIDATKMQRFHLFPHVHDEKDAIADDADRWSTEYAQKEELSSIGIREDELNRTLNHIKNSKNKPTRFVVTESHEDIVLTVAQTKRETSMPVHLVNVDHHHDAFLTGDPDDPMDMNCGNWLRYMKDNLMIDRAAWIRSKDSEFFEKQIPEGQIDLDEIVGFEEFESHELNENVDVIFLCRSGGWSPPHLDQKFEKLISDIEAQTGLTAERQTDTSSRWTPELKKKIISKRKEMEEKYKTDNICKKCKADLRNYRTGEPGYYNCSRCGEPAPAPPPKPAKKSPISVAESHGNSMWHIKPDGTVAKCRATKRACPYGGADRHYKTREEAQQAFDDDMKGQFGK
jgi:ribosomal protein L37AE/L43A